MLDRETAELLGGRILAARRAVVPKMNQTQLAEAVRALGGPKNRCSKTTIRQNEAGWDGRVVRAPSLERLGEIAKALGTTASTLLDGVL